MVDVQQSGAQEMRWRTTSMAQAHLTRSGPEGPYPYPINSLLADLYHKCHPTPCQIFGDHNQFIGASQGKDLRQYKPQNSWDSLLDLALEASQVG